MRSSPLSFVLCLLSFLFVLSSQATFYPSAATGPAGDPGGSATRQTIAQAIADADALLETFASTEAAAWPETWRPFAGSAAVDAVAVGVFRVRSAFASLREGWDSLSMQTVTLKKGWNAFDVYVDDPAPVSAILAPSGYADRVRAAAATSFADPTNAGAREMLDRLATLARTYVDVRLKLVRAYTSSVAADWPLADLYVHQGAGEARSQFTTDVTAEAEAYNPYLSWSATAPDSYNLQRLSAGAVCTCFSTGTVSRTVALLGVGTKAGSMRWHKTGGSANPAEWNFLGLAIPSGRQHAENVLRDLDFTCSSYAKLTGTDPTKPDFSVGGAGDPLSVADGDVLIASATATSTWYPAPIALPAAGVRIAAGDRVGTFTLRNDTAAAQTVTGTLHRTGCLATALTPIAGVEVCASEMLGWSAWNFSEDGKTNLVFVDTLAAGESRRYRLRFNRTAYDVLARERGYSDGFSRTFSAVMRFRYGSNTACTYLGLTADSDAGAVTLSWPAGLWVGSMTFDRVSQVTGNHTIVHDVPAAGTMTVRGIVHVSATGRTRLLHHVLLQTLSVTNDSGEVTSQTRVYADEAEPDDSSAGTVVRLDSIAMDIEHPVVVGDGSLTNAVSFAWKVASDGRANPLYHPFHPNHDGLQWDFKTPSPDGDDTDNYRNGTIKPELWTIENTLRLTTSVTEEDAGEATLSGKCSWELGNLRRRVNGENIRTSGTFTFRRLDTVGPLYGAGDLDEQE